MKVWHEQDYFWSTWEPILFDKERWVKTPEEIDKILALIRVKPPAIVLDLCCGPGRHSLELARRGFTVTGVDRTKKYLQQAAKRAKQERLKIEFILKDMRRFYRTNAFDVVLNLFTSFGYFKNIGDDRRVVKNVYRSLKINGVFIMQLMGKEVLARIWQPKDWHMTKDAIILEERKVCKNWSWIENRWIMIKKHKRIEFKVSHRIYSAVELKTLLMANGFKKVKVYGSLLGTPYDNNAKALLLVAYKGIDKR